MLEVEAILEQTRDEIEHVVVTGGEPMLFEATELLCEGLKAKGKTITIETAGTVYRDLPCDLMSISPKLPNSDPEPVSGPAANHPRIRSDLTAFLRLTETYTCQLKFVVDPERNLDPQLAELDRILAASSRKHPVLIMPEGVDGETLHRREKLLIPLCMERGWRLCARRHIDWFGNKRGT